MEKVTLLVQGSAPEPYEVTFYHMAEKELYATCTCPAGENGQYCKHRISILLGDPEGICSDNKDEIAQIGAWLSGSKMDSALARLATAEAGLDQAKSRVSAAKKNLALAMRPPLFALAPQGEMPNTKKIKSTKVQPDSYFADWHYLIEKCHYSALGLTLREFVDQPRTKIARESAPADSDLPKIKVLYQAWAHANPHQYDFHEGDMFYCRAGENAIQIVKIKDQFEVHHFALNFIPMQRMAFLISERNLVDWLKFGATPFDCRITADQSSVDLLRFSLI